MVQGVNSPYLGGFFDECGKLDSFGSPRPVDPVFKLGEKSDGVRLAFALLRGFTWSAPVVVNHNFSGPVEMEDLLRHGASEIQVDFSVDGDNSNLNYCSQRSSTRTWPCVAFWISIAVGRLGTFCPLRMRQIVGCGMFASFAN